MAPGDVAPMREKRNPRRAPGTGSLIVRKDLAGRETFYGKWTTDNGRQVKRRLGRKRLPGTSNGLTRRQAEVELRRQISEVRVDAPVRVGLGVGEAGEAYL